MAEEKIEAEVLQKLEEEMRSKMSQTQKMLKDLQSQATTLPEELKKIGDVKGVAQVAEAVKEMQDEIGEKRQMIETALKELQSDMGLLKDLRDKATTQDVSSEVKSLVGRVKEKKDILKKTIEEIAGLKDKYTKKFFG